MSRPAFAPTRLVSGLVLGAVMFSSACSIRSLAINSLADTLAEGASVYTSDNDPELVREALPFNLKTLETLLEADPDHRGLLLSACSTFTMYGVGFIQADAEYAEWEEFDYEKAEALLARARNLFIRARGYCLRRAEVDYPGISGRLRRDPEDAVSVFAVQDVDMLFCLGSAWGSAIAVGLDRPELSADFGAVRAVLERALMLDEDYNRGALHGVFITLESLPPALGGSPERAREHFQRAVELSDGLDASPYVSLALGVSVPTQNREEFESLLRAALAIDPDEDESTRLLTIISQRRAALMLDHIDELFEPVGDQEEQA